MRLLSDTLGSGYNGGIMRRMRKTWQTRLRVMLIDCPYCDGENILIAKDALNLGSEQEMACKHCRSFFTPSENKVRVAVVANKTKTSGKAA